MTDFAQSQLGDIVFIELPAVGARVTAGKRCSVVESVKAVSDIYAPLSGTVVEVNETLVDAPEIVNKEPYDSGWIAVIEFGTDFESEGLMDSEAYAELAAKGGH